MAKRHSSRRDAEDLVRIFHARDPREETRLGFSWPERFVEAGAGQAEMYRSDKWQENPAEYEDYKHVAESPRLTYVVPGALRDRRGNEVELVGEEVELERPMPDHIAVLGDVIGIQLRLFVAEPDGTIVLPPGDEGLYEARLRHAKLAAARHPKTQEPFLVVYTEDDGILMLITGEELRIEPEGIAG